MKRMKKTLYILTAIMLITMMTSFTVWAGKWRMGDGKWWYDNENGTYLVNGWHWVDGNGDGMAECYFFDENGWILTNSMTPDGYQVDANGAWNINGIVQIKPVVEVKRNDNIPADAIEYNGHHYYFYQGVCKTWEDAKVYCESLGGYLAIINDDKENTILYDAMKAVGYKNAYFGISDAEEEGTWRCVDGTISEYTNWAKGEPNNERNREDYAMFYYKSPAYQWNDGDFGHGTVNDNIVFICEWDD